MLLDYSPRLNGVLPSCPTALVNPGLIHRSSRKMASAGKTDRAAVSTLWDHSRSRGFAHRPAS
jgi:hypothetical protein